MEAGRNRVAQMVTAQMGWKGLSGPEIERLGRVSRATVDRVKRGDPVSNAFLRALGDSIDLPRDFLLYVLDGDVEAVTRAAAHDEDLVRWTVDMILSTNGVHPTNGAPTATTSGISPDPADAEPR
jgi:hypothetical protein